MAANARLLVVLTQQIDLQAQLDLQMALTQQIDLQIDLQVQKIHLRGNQIKFGTGSLYLNIQP